MTVPAITQNQGTESLIRSAILVGSALVTGIILAWLNAHGFTTTDITFLGYTISPDTLIGGAVFTTLSTIAAAVWGWLRGTQIGQVFEQHEVAAVQAGINLATAGQAITVVTTQGNRVPLPVTPATAKEIVQNFGPHMPAPVVSEEQRTRDLNLEQLKPLG